MSSVSSPEDQNNEKWWQSHQKLRGFYHPLLLASNDDYRKWNKKRRDSDPRLLKKMTGELLKEAERSVDQFRYSTSEIVGYEDIIDELLSSVHYWVLDDQEFKKICSIAPPKVFIIKGSSGTGKTSVVHSAMVQAFEHGKKAGIPVFAHSISSHKIFTKWLGESEKRLAAAFDNAFAKPSVIFMDEAHSFVQDSSSEKPSSDSGSQTYVNVQTTLLEKVNELVTQNHKCILILATNEFGSLLQTVKRRGSSGTIDLDRELSRETLTRIVQKQIEKYKLGDLKPDDILKTIEQKVKALGHGSITPADVTNAFSIVIDSKTRNARTSYLRRLSKVFEREQDIHVTLEDFRNISKLKEYAEPRKSDELRSLVTRIKPQITLDDVGGLDEIKEQILKDVEISMDVELARRMGASPVRGIMLHGPPGCGKTWLAQAIAGEIRATIYMIRAPQMIKPYYGQTEKVISDLFDEARKNAPAIIVIDEVDALMLRRDAGGNLGAVTTLLSEMGGMKPLEGVVVIGTTNKLHLIDEAFLRAGRFDRVIEIPPPKNDKERVEIINIHLKKCASFLDPRVTGEAVLPLFGKRTLSPARIERIVSDAIELRVKELNAIHKLSQMPDQQDTTQVQRLKHIYQDDLLRLRTNLGFSPPAEVETKSIDSASLSHLLEVTPENYKLNLNHFKEAINLSKDNQIEEIQRITSAIRGSDPEPTVGKVYGLAALSGSGTGDGLAADGTVAVIECACNPYGDRGHAEVIGSEVADSIKASAEHARIFLNEQSEWNLRNVEFFIDFITFAKGLDSKVIQGPSAGAAITLAEFSALTKEKVLPNVVITGGVTPKGELIQVGGLDFKGMGKFVAALNTDGIDTIVIPESNFANLAEEDKTFFAQKGLKVVAAKNFWEVAEVALESRPNRGQIIDKIRAYRKETNEHSNAGGSHY